ncbi:MAG TPA: hypothetical protein DET40_18005 [Lentisphaeria bacterium]|nr:MAG: hypothetical protein A2X45_02010 [Lentisphaerae bacterium GWF2_50_93]HCE45437.1 hypothetical protein [Lentisphaeria bacterium]
MGRKNKKNRHPKNLCRSLIRLDTGRIKDAFRRKCHEARKDFENNQKTLDFYEKQERPAFASWLRLNMGAEMAEFKRFQEDISRKNLILKELEYRGAVMPNADRVELHVQLVLELDSGVKNPFTHMEDDFSGRGADGQDGGGFDEDFDDMDDEDEIFGDEDILEDFVDELEDVDEDEFMRDPFGTFREMFDRVSGRHGGKTASARVNARENRLKEIYRVICKKLHPDTGADFNDKNSGLWHEAQEAYEYKDIERLEAILAICELESGNPETAVTCSQMMEIVSHYREGVESIRNIIYCERRSGEDWGFLSWNEKEKKRRLEKLRKLMKKDLDSCRRSLEQVEARISRWKMSGRFKNTRKTFVHKNQMAFDF